jgi:hypothetical protein
MTPPVGPANEQRARDPGAGGRMAGVRGQDRIRENYGDPEIA